MKSVPIAISQTDLLQRVLPLMAQSGQRYGKHKQVWAKPAPPNAQVTTYTTDGAETMNTAQVGDFLVKNSTTAQEQYLVSAASFSVRYMWQATGEAGWDVYAAIGQIQALELTNATLSALQLPAQFHFEARWGAAMKAVQGDFLATPLDGSEVYRIARQEFFETYRLLTF